MAWTPEPTYEKPDISVRASTIYYQLMAPLMLPFAEGRLLNLFRCREGKCFFQRNREHPPSGDAFKPPVRFAPVVQKNGRTEEYLYITDEAGIAACAEADAVEFHGWGSRAEDAERPDRLVIDLDPDVRIGFDAVKDAALQLRTSLDALGLDAFALLTGGKGVHVVVPLDPVGNWQAVRGFAKAFCSALAEADPKRFTVELPIARRRGRIFLDFLRNQRTATAILPYSARARSGSPVAAPVTWEELHAIDSSAAFSIADAEQLIKRAKSPALRHWGNSGQRLPAFS